MSRFHTIFLPRPLVNLWMYRIESIQALMALMMMKLERWFTDVQCPITVKRFWQGLPIKEFLSQAFVTRRIQ